jgi:hypothetical protein
MALKTFQRGEVVYLTRNVKDWSGNYIDPSAFTVTIQHKATREVLEEEAAMVRDSLGHFHYEWHSEATYPVGEIIAIYTAVSGDIPTIWRASFMLEKARE